MPTLKQTSLAIFQLLAALLLCGIAIYVAESGVDIKWVVTGVFTLAVFGWVCFRTRDFWGDSRYWATVGGAFVAHCVAVGVLQRNTPLLPGMVYGSIGLLEAISLFGLLLFMFD
jgi:hypothetical protein